MNSLAYNRSEYGNTNIDMAYDANDEAEIDRYYSVLSTNNSFQANKYCLPYIDHCYASNLPTTSFEYSSNNRDVTPPLPLTEPLPPFADIDDFNIRQQQQHMYSQQQASNNYNNKNSNAEVDPYEGSVTRCVCDFLHDDGYMICCDRCGVWQHVDCMGVDRKRIPESYLCELCLPRPVDKRRAVRIQSKKKEQMEMEESSAGSGEDSGMEERKVNRRRRNRKDSRKKVEKGKPRKRTSSGMGPDNKIEQKRSKQQHGTFSDSDNSAVERWSDKHGLEGDDALSSLDSKNTYSPEVLNILMMKAKSTSVNNTALSLVRQQLQRKPFTVVQYHDDASKGLEAIENIKANQAVVEYNGHTLMRKDYERHSDLSYPFTVCYMGINGLELCVDSSKCDNEAKFIRRSCTPNAKVVHILERTGLRFFICATKAIPAGKEITIPFYFDYNRSDVSVQCHCGKPNCLISKSQPPSPPPNKSARQGKKKGLDSDTEGGASPRKKSESMEAVHEEVKTSSGRVVKPPKNRGALGEYHHTTEAPHNSITTTINTLIKQSSSSNTTNNISDDIDLLKQLSSSINVAKTTGDDDDKPKVEADKTTDKNDEEKVKTVVDVEKGADKTKATKGKVVQHNKNKVTKSKKEVEEKEDKEDRTEEVENKTSDKSGGEEEEEEDEEEKKKENNDSSKPNKVEANRKKNMKLLAEIQSTLNTAPPTKKTREQRKIEDAERRFEKIEMKSSKEQKTVVNKVNKSRSAKENKDHTNKTKEDNAKETKTKDENTKETKTKDENTKETKTKDENTKETKTKDDNTKETKSSTNSHKTNKDSDKESNKSGVNNRGKKADDNVEGEEEKVRRAPSRSASATSAAANKQKATVKSTKSTTATTKQTTTTTASTTTNKKKTTTTASTTVNKKTTAAPKPAQKSSKPTSTTTRSTRSGKK